MTPATLFAGLTTACAVAAIASYVVARRAPRRGVLAAAVVTLVVLVGKSALCWFPVVEAALCPWPDWLLVRDWVMSLAAAAFFGLAAGLLPIAWNRAAIGVVAALLIARCARDNAWMLHPTRFGAETAPDRSHHLTQSTNFTCAPCACAMALSYVGVRATEADMSERCLTRADGGTTVFDAWRGLTLALAGTPWRARVRYATAAELATPGLVAVIDDPHARHALATRGDGDAVILHDALDSEPRRVPIARLAQQYSGTAVVIVPR